MTGFLHKLWDETLAGPAPETGLGKLRKYDSFSAATTTVRSPAAEEVPISRSIIIVRSPSGLRTTTTPDPASPSVPITPRTPLTPKTPGGDFNTFTRRKSLRETVESAMNTSLKILRLGDYKRLGSLLRGEMRLFALKFDYQPTEADGLRFLSIRQHRFQFPKGII